MSFLDFLAVNFRGSQKRLATRKEVLGLAGSQKNLPLSKVIILKLLLVVTLLQLRIHRTYEQKTQAQKT